MTMKKVTIGKMILHLTAVIQIFEGDVEDQENADTSQSESSSSDDMSHESDTDDV